MATAKLITLQVSDIVKWFRENELIVNETFQRYSVWTAAAKTYLIDTILTQLPIPKIYLRTFIDPGTQTSVREIVDGQQRIRAIVEFANNDFKLTSRSEQFAGFKYKDLSTESQENFLGYTIGAEQLLNASDDDVIDIFSRLNSYTVSLNAAEKRHAKYQTEFKFAVRKASQDWRGFWEKYNIFTTKHRFRMADDVLMAEIFGVFLEGVRDGGAKKIDTLYKRQDDERFAEEIHKKIRRQIDTTLSFIDDRLGVVLGGEFSKSYHILILVAAYAHHKFGIPRGQIESMPGRCRIASVEKITDGLANLERAIQDESPQERYKNFVNACASSTHRIASRRIRFLEFTKLFCA